MQQEKHSRAMVLGLQHLLAMYSGSILVPMMIGQALAIIRATDIFSLNRYFYVWGSHFSSVATQ